MCVASEGASAKIKAFNLPSYVFLCVLPAYSFIIAVVMVDFRVLFSVVFSSLFFFFHHHLLRFQAIRSTVQWERRELK